MDPSLRSNGSNTRLPTQPSVRTAGRSRLGGGRGAEQVIASADGIPLYRLAITLSRAASDVDIEALMRQPASERAAVATVLACGLRRDALRVSPLLGIAHDRRWPMPVRLAACKALAMIGDRSAAVVEAPRVDGPAVLSPALAAAKAEIHSDLLRRHAAAIDITNRAGIRRLLMQLTDEHFRLKPPAALVTAADRERLVEILFDEVIGLGPLEAPLRDPDITEIMVNRPEQIFVERRGRIELTNLAFEDEASLRRVIDRIVSTIGRRVDESEPMCDARLKDGSRVNVVIRPVAIYGPCLTSRKFARQELTPQKIVAH